MAASKATTVLDVIMSLFPHGYVDHAGYRARLEATGQQHRAPSGRHTSFENPPCSAVDLFALTGQLLLKSGAYHHISPTVAGARIKDKLTVSPAARKRWIASGKSWRGDRSLDLPKPPAEVERLWKELMRFAGERVYRSPGYTVTARKWWEAAVALFCIADEAALDIGFQAEGRKSAQAEYIETPIRERQELARRAGKNWAPSTLSRTANPDQVCILPKSRTPRVGCTLRSLSHNLSLLPGRGLARAHWSLAPISQAYDSDGSTKPFNLIVLPLPFGIQAHAFKGMPADEGSWGWFDVVPHWCPPTGYETSPDGMTDFLSFIEDVISRAAQDVGSVQALVLPEAALSQEAFKALCERLRGIEGFELLIAGLFDGPLPVGKGIRHGNFTGMARFSRSSKGTVAYDISIREKHHRWRLDRGQIETYALGASLDVNRGWWEHIDLLSRTLDVFVLRGGASVTTLICEDLARNDPCQELVRGIGPNLVVALLMDGPQRKDRWPARYATVLAEDPGSSVLSVTSLGLIRRTNQAGHFAPANEIALFRDDTGATTEIRLPAGAQAMCLTLQPTALTERTLDGRPDKSDAQSWRLSGVQPVRIDEPNEKIMDGFWPAPFQAASANPSSSSS